MLPESILLLPRQDSIYLDDDGCEGIVVDSCWSHHSSAGGRESRWTGMDPSDEVRMHIKRAESIVVWEFVEKQTKAQIEAYEKSREERILKYTVENRTELMIEGRKRDWEFPLFVSDERDARSRSADVTVRLQWQSLYDSVDFRADHAKWLMFAERSIAGYREMWTAEPEMLDAHVELERSFCAKQSAYARAVVPYLGLWIPVATNNRGKTSPSVLHLVSKVGDGCFRATLHMLDGSISISAGTQLTRTRRWEPDPEHIEIEKSVNGVTETEDGHLQIEDLVATVLQTHNI